MPAPVGYSLETKSGTSAAATSTASFNSSGWNVAFGNGKNASGAAVPSWVWAGAGIGALLWMLKRKG